MAKFKDPLKNIGTRVTPQDQPIPGTNQVPNNAGGYTFSLDDWKQLERFLILGTEGGTYYVREQKLTADNATLLLRCIQADGPRVVQMVLDIDKDDRAPKMNPLIFSIAATLATGTVEGRRAAEQAVQKVCRTGYHLYLFAGYVKNFKNIGGKVTKRAFSRWFTEKDVNSLSYQFIKYRQREGWTMRDLLNLAHPKPSNESYAGLFKWAIDTQYGNDVSVPTDIPLIVAFSELQQTDSEARVIELVRAHNLPWEALPDKFMNSKVVWAALLDSAIGYTALLRQLPRLTNLGLVKDLSYSTDRVVTMLTNPQKIAASHVHPLALLVALKQYSAGHGDKGQLTWVPVRMVIDALDSAFYTSFDSIESTGKRHYLAIDVSGSMDMGSVAGSSLTPREGAAAMAMASARTETNWCIYGFSDKLVDLGIGATDRLDNVIQKMSRLPFARTDCAQPMIDAQKRGLEVDCFSIFTDNETYAGSLHPSQAIQQYRSESGISNASLVVCGMTSTGFTIADPADDRMLDVVGMDASVPGLISSFSR